VSLNGWYQPKFIVNHVGLAKVNFSTDVFKWGLISGPAGDLAARSVTEGYEFVSDLLNNNGTALSEVTGGGYARQNAASVTYGLSGLVITFSMANPDWNPLTATVCYAWLHDETASSGTDATRPLLGIFDLGGAQNPSSQPFTLDVNGSGIATDTVTQ